MRSLRLVCVCLLLLAAAMASRAATVTTTFAFTSNSDGFSVIAGDADCDWVSNVGNDFSGNSAPGSLHLFGILGQFDTSRVVTAKSGITWESLGVPTNSTVTAVSARLRATQPNRGYGYFYADFIVAIIRTSDGATLANPIFSNTFGSDLWPLDTWMTYTDDISYLINRQGNSPSNTGIRVQISLDCGSDLNSTWFNFRLDALELTIHYTTP